MQILRWHKQTPPTERELREQMRHDGPSPYTWSNESNFTYAAHTHSYKKVLYCAIVGSQGVTCLEASR